MFKSTEIPRKIIESEFQVKVKLKRSCVYKKTGLMGQKHYSTQGNICPCFTFAPLTLVIGQILEWANSNV